MFTLSATSNIHGSTAVAPKPLDGDASSWLASDPADRIPESSTSQEGPGSRDRPDDVRAAQADQARRRRRRETNRESAGRASERRREAYDELEREVVALRRSGGQERVAAAEAALRDCRNDAQYWQQECLALRQQLAAAQATVARFDVAGRRVTALAMDLQRRLDQAAADAWLQSKVGDLDLPFVPTPDSPATPGLRPAGSMLLPPTARHPETRPTPATFALPLPQDAWVGQSM